MDNNFMEKDNSYSSLKHHGILGMKWGVRRYQNEDGTLTAAGKKRYSAQDITKQNTEILKRRIQRKLDADTERARREANPAYRAQKEREEAQERFREEQHPEYKLIKELQKDPIDRILDALPAFDGTRQVHADSQRVHDGKKANELSDAELRDRLNRINMEQQYDRLTDADVHRGKSAAQNVLKVLGTVAGTTSTLLTIYSNAERIEKILKKIPKG